MSQPLGYAIVGMLGLVAILLLAVFLYRTGPQGPGGSAISFSGAWTWVAEKKTYIVGTLLLISDQVHDLGFMTDAQTWKVQKTLFAIAAFTIAAAQNRVAQGQVAAVEQAKTTADTATDTNAIVTQTQQTVKAALKLPVTPLSVPAAKPAAVPGSVL